MADEKKNKKEYQSFQPDKKENNDVPIVSEEVKEDFSELLALRTGLVNEFAIAHKDKIPAIIECEKRGRNRSSMIDRLNAIINPVDESLWEVVDFCQRVGKKKRHEVAFVAWLKTRGNVAEKMNRENWEKLYKIFMP